jgi:ABC transport system ATP-binding/permease protein
VVTHDRYFLERVCDVTYALTGAGRCELLPGGIEQYLASRRETASQPPPRAPRTESQAARERRAAKELARIEGQLGKLDERITELHAAMAATARDHVGLAQLNDQLNEMLARKAQLEEAWLAAAEDTP